jgi:hypothetical protein
MVTHSSGNDSLSNPILPSLLPCMLASYSLILIDMDHTADIQLHSCMYFPIMTILSSALLLPASSHHTYIYISHTHTLSLCLSLSLAHTHTHAYTHPLSMSHKRGRQYHRSIGTTCDINVRVYDGA